MTKKTAVAKNQGSAMPSDLPEVELTDNSRQVLRRRYLRRGEDGQPIESIDEMFWRVAYNVARAEEKWGNDINERAIEFYHLLGSKKFFPNSPTFTGAGTPLGQLAACFVLPINDDMGRDTAGIFQSLRDAALIQQLLDTLLVVTEHDEGRTCEHHPLVPCQRDQAPGLFNSGGQWLFRVHVLAGLETARVELSVGHT